MKTLLGKQNAIVLVVLLALSFASAQTQGGAQPAREDAVAALATLELVKEGSYFYRKRAYKRAIGPYQTALDREKEKRRLDNTIWKVLVDNLGMAYGITGDLKKAKETFEYGISKDPDYPLFYYNLACTYGEMDQEDKAIQYLKLAFERKENMIPGEKMPNPARDSSFERFMKNDKFLAALKELKEK